MSTSPRTAVITGCSRGIGNMLAREFHRNGVRVFATARTTENLADLEKLGIQCLRLNVDDHQSIVDCFTDVKKALGDEGLSFLVNNAGIASSGPATEIPLATVRAIFETNLFGVIDMNQTFLPLLQIGHGTMVHIGSVASVAPVPWLSAYLASKAALYAYCDTLRLEVATLGVGVVCVQTGTINTDMNRERPSLDHDSLYKSVRKAHQERHQGGQPKGIAVEAFAKAVVDRLLAPKRWWHSKWLLWVGGQATEMRIVNWLAGNWPGDLWGLIMRKTYMLESQSI